MLELLRKLLYLDWRRHGAVIREASVARSHMWYADFAPRLQRSSGPELVAPPERQRTGQGKLPPRADKPPVAILIHGLGASSTSFYPLIPRLLRRFRVIVPDLPGYGWSRPPRGRDHLLFPELLEALEKFVQKVAPRGAYLVGNSMGGWLAAKVASSRPDLARGIALLNPGGPALRAEDWVDFARVLYAEDRAVMGEYFSRLFHNPPLALRLFTRDFQRIMRGPSVASLVASLAESDFIAAEELARVRCPSLLVWGESDRLIPQGCRDFYLQHLAGVRYEPLSDCGHCPQLEAPKRTAELVMQLPAMAAAASVEAA